MRVELETAGRFPWLLLGNLSDEGETSKEEKAKIDRGFNVKKKISNLAYYKLKQKWFRLNLVTKATILKQKAGLQFAVNKFAVHALGVFKVTILWCIFMKNNLLTQIVITVQGYKKSKGYMYVEQKMLLTSYRWLGVNSARFCMGK